MANTVEIIITGKNLTKPEFDKAVADARKAGKDIGAGLSGGAGEELKKDLPKDVEKPLEDSGRKGGQAAGKAAGGGISPLIVGAFAAAATAGPAVLLAATAAAVIGAGALVTKGNLQLTASYQKLGADASSAIRQAAAPLVPALYSSVQVLDQGIAKIGPELKSVFSAVAPDATALTSGLVSLVGNTLPGMASGLRAIAPYAQDIAVDFGKIGSGLGGFFQGLGGGAAGGTAGLNALSDVLKELLTDVGSIVGSLSNGLGPALHDVADVVIPLAHGVTEFVGVLNPAAIRAAADAAGALFLAFKGASLAGLLAEGTTFIGFLSAAAAGEIALTGATGLTGKAMASLGLAEDAALGPLGLLAAGVTALGLAAASAGKLQSDLGVSTDKITQTMKDAAAGSDSATRALDAMTSGMKGSQAQGQDTSASIAQLDQALTALNQSNPAAAAKEYQVVLKDLNLSAQDGAAKFPNYTKAMAGAAPATQALADATAQVNNSLVTEQIHLAQAAGKAGDNAVAALSFASAQGGLNDALSTAISDFDLAKGASSAYKTALDALYGKYQSYSDAQATFTTDLDNAAKQLVKSKDGFDVNTDAGAKNYQLMSTLATANENRAEALLRETGSQDQANKMLQAGALALDATAKKAGFTKTQIDALNLALYGTKNIGSIQVPIGVDTSPARSAIRQLVSDIEGRHAYIQVDAVAGSTGGRALMAHGGVRGAASGGPRGGRTVVGEHGIELVDLPPGTTVHSNPDSQRMLAQGGGGGEVRVVLEWAGSSSDPIFQMLREGIRVRGGNASNSVQVVLGQNF